MNIYDEEPETDFWLLYEFTNGDGFKFEKTKNIKAKHIFSYVDKKIRDSEENKVKDGSN